MGNFLKSLKEEIQLRSESLNEFKNPLLNCSLTKLREYHGSFKSICDSFSINATEFDQIFNQSEQAFLLWDTDKNQIIDALELFTGLVIFSDASFELKIRYAYNFRFLFDLFDFNANGCISKDDIEFIFISAVNATYKIYQIQKNCEMEQIGDYMNNFFLDNQVVSLNIFNKWCMNQQDIYDYFLIIQKVLPIRLTIQNTLYENIFHYQQQQEKEENQHQYKNHPQSNFLIPAVEKVEGTKHHQRLNQYILTLIEKRQQIENPIEENQDINATVSWVYGKYLNQGFNCQDKLNAIQFIPSIDGKKANDKLIYFSACIVIIFFPNLNQQKHYLLHDVNILNQRQIMSVAAGEQSSIVASGEKGENPSIHIWDSNNLQNIGIIKGFHKEGVKIMSFFENNKYLITCGSRFNTPILIYNIKDLTPILSTFVKTPVCDLALIQNIDSINSNKAVSSSQHKFVLFQKHFFTIFQKQNGKFITTEFNCKQISSSHITSGTSFDYKQSIHLITGHQNGQVLLFINLNFEKVLTNYKTEITKIIQYKTIMTITNNKGQLFLWDVQSLTQIGHINLKDYQFRLFSYHINNLIISKHNLYLSTQCGDLVEISFDDFRNILQNLNSTKRLNYIIQIQSQNNQISIQSNKNHSTNLYLGGDRKFFFNISLDNHDLIDFHSCGSEITAASSVYSEDFGQCLALGCQNGYIILQQNQNELKKFYQHQDSIQDIIFSNSGLHMIVACKNQGIYIFQQVNSYEYQLPPKEQNLLTRIFMEDSFVAKFSNTNTENNILIVTNKNTHYQIDIVKLQMKEIFSDQEKVNTSNWSSLYCKDPKNIQFGPSQINLTNDFILFHNSGHLFICRNSKQLQEYCYQDLRGFLLKSGHSSTISSINYCPQDQCIYTVGQYDFTIIQWKLHKVMSKKQTNTDKWQNPISMPGFHKRDLNFTQLAQSFEPQNRDCFTLFRGTFQNFQIFVQKYFGHMNKMSKSDKEYVLKRPPSLSLKLQKILGFQAFDKRQSLHYIHQYDRLETIQKKPVTIHNNVKIPAFAQREIIYNQNNTKTLTDHHESCDKKFVYFVSKYVILFDPLTEEQTFYEAHKSKITCITIHHNKSLVASGEQGSEPMIHIWGIINREPYMILRTQHKGSISMIQFSRCGRYIFSISNDKTYSIEVNQ